MRLDSGDLDRLSREARRILDHAGLGRAKIFASGGLDEHEVAELVRAGAPVDAFGIGTQLGVSADAPSSAPTRAAGPRSARKNFSNTCGCSAAGIPSP